MNQMTNSDKNVSEWFILRGELKFGPYDYFSMIEMLQDGELYEYTMVWAPHLENWTPAGEVSDFSKDRLQLLIQTGDPVVRALKARKNPRQNFQTPVYGHNNLNFFEGQTTSISEAGGLILLNNPLLVPGEKILVHFQESSMNNIPFNVVAEVTRKNYSKQRLNVKSGLYYSVRFLFVQDEGKKQLKTFSQA